MTLPLVSFDGSIVRVGGQSWAVRFPVADARLVGGVVVLLYAPSSGPRDHQFRNVEGFDSGGRKLWTAEHPTNETADVYLQFLEVEPLRLWSFACYRCTLDPATGRLLDAVFTK